MGLISFGDVVEVCRPPFVVWVCYCQVLGYASYFDATLFCEFPALFCDGVERANQGVSGNIVLEL